jgi:hypothetical protein
VPELVRRDLAHHRPRCPGELGTPVGRPGVDDDDLDLLVRRLFGKAGEATAEIVSSVLHGNHDGDQRGVAARRNW